MQPTDGTGTNVDAAPVRVGDVLAGKYRVEKLLGVGGMGVVVRAHHMYLDERVAIKFILPEALAIPEVVTRFAREARAAVKIRNEHVARVIDVGTLETGVPYMVMEYLEGVDLSTLKERPDGGMLEVPEAVDYVLQALEAIAEAHALGIVHRDLKPANLFLAHRADGTSIIKVLDFGISKVTSIPGGSSPEMALTKTATSMGSPLYMSPEQMVSSRDVDARTDIWAVGVILYELLSGQAPFGGDTLPQLCAAILQQQPRMIGEMRGDVPAELEAVVRRCLDKDPANRFNHVGELAVALAPFAPHSAAVSITRITGLFKAPLTSASSIVIPSPQVTTGAIDVQSSTAVAWGQTGARSSSWKVPVIATVGILAFFVVGAIAVVVAVGIMRQQGPDEIAASSAPSTSVTASAATADTTESAGAPVPESSASAPAASASEAPPAPVATRPPRAEPTPTKNRPPTTTTATATKKKPPGVSDFGDRK